ncbi:MAG: HD domain-containing protein [Fusobacteriaceae bacterium]
MGRLRQGLQYIFCRYDKNNESEIKNILFLDEWKIFSEMSDYDKNHGYIIFNRAKNNENLRNNILFLKLALLHDCGKENSSLFRRVKKVLIGDKILEEHSENGYKKLLKINYPLAVLIKMHHENTKNFENLEIKIFQKLDDM